MEKTIEVNNTIIRLASNAATPLRYKMQFHSDYFADLMKLAKSLDTGTENEFDLSEVSWESLAMLDLSLLYNFVWIYAKTADKSIPEPLEWLDSLESLPIESFSKELQDLISNSIKTKKK
ncbi:hypothetical protein ACI1TZ_08890 [Lactococcus formosensis subsp. formosensis]|uniref:hypothetical protein n=1 Tax=Lactococcus TaxID=1357 RepID=UPI0022E90744|nr:hypothetical protein [Lactococcus petauri]